MKKNLIPIMILALLASVGLNITQYFQISQQKDLQEGGLPFLLSTVTGRIPALVLEDLETITPKDMALLYYDYANKKNNFMYILTTEGLYDNELEEFNRLFNEINDRTFEKYLLEIYTNEIIWESDLEVLEKYHEAYNNFIDSISNEVSLHSVGDTKKVVYAYYELVKEANEMAPAILKIKN